MTTATKHRIQVESTWLHYETVGVGPPLVLVHGLAGSPRWWTRNIDVFARHFQLYLINLSGFGNRPRRPHFELSLAAHYLECWLDQLQIEQASFIGHSMGGRIVAELAADQPARVGRLVLVDSPILPFRRSYRHQLWGMASAVPRAPLSLLGVVAWDTLLTGLWHVARVGLDLFRSDLVHKLAQIQTAPLIVWGANDTIVPLVLGEALHRQLRGSRFALISGAGHVPMWEQPAAFNQAVLTYLLEPPESG